MSSLGNGAGETRNIPASWSRPATRQIAPRPVPRPVRVQPPQTRRPAGSPGGQPSSAWLVPFVIGAVVASMAAGLLIGFGVWGQDRVLAQEEIAPPAVVSTPTATARATEAAMIASPQPTLSPTARAFQVKALPLITAVPVANLPTATPVFAGPLWPAVDPDISRLLNAVSREQLIIYVRTLEGFGTRHTLSEMEASDHGIGVAGRWIHDQFKWVGGGRLQVHYDPFPLLVGGQTIERDNVVAVLPGEDANSGALILMAHYDSRNANIGDSTGFAPGANDNASGVALLLEAARLLSTRTWQKSILFVAFAGEEQGNFGSRHFVQAWPSAQTPIIAAINNDVVGGHHDIRPALQILTAAPNTSGGYQLARYIDAIAGLYMPAFDIEFNDEQRPNNWSDHDEFAHVGIPAVRLVEVEEDYRIRHTEHDTFERLNYDYFTRVVQLNLAVIANLAGAPNAPSDLEVRRVAGSGTFALNWTPDPATSAYVVSFRPLHSPTYAPFRYLDAAQGSNVVLNGFDDGESYAVSMAALSQDGRLGFFSSEIIVGPGLPNGY